jgi:prefoldin subunit 5
LKEDIDKDREKMMQELTNLDNQKEELKETVD